MAQSPPTCLICARPVLDDENRQARVSGFEHIDCSLAHDEVALGRGLLGAPLLGTRISRNGERYEVTRVDQGGLLDYYGVLLDAGRA